MDAPFELPADTFGEDVLLISGFGDDGRGGLFAFDGRQVEQLDQFGTTGLAYGEGRLGRLLRAADDYESVGELLVYDAAGILEYRRLDRLIDPHGIIWHPDGWLMVSSARNAVSRLSPGGVLDDVWCPTATHDAWHPNCLELVDGQAWVTAFGRFEDSRGWQGSAARHAGFLLNLESGAEFGGFTHPHSPRLFDGVWWICESQDQRLVALDGSTGERRTFSPLGGYTRGLASAGEFVFAGVSSDRQGAVWRDASVAVISRDDGRLRGRIPVPVLEIFDLLVVPGVIVEGARRGFDTNLQRVAEQESRRIWEAFGSADPSLARLGLPVPLADCRADVHCDQIPPRRPGTTEVIPVRVANNGPVPLATVPPYPVYLSYRWFDLDGTVAMEGIRTRLAGVLTPGSQAAIDLPLRAPDEAGTYRLAVTLVQEGVCWFTDLDDGNGWFADIDVRPTSR